MVVRFLQTTGSGVPGMPFMPGQIIHLPCMTPELRDWLREGRVEVVPVPEQPEAAVVDASERTAVLPRAKGRHVTRDTV